MPRPPSWPIGDLEFTKKTKWTRGVVTYAISANEFILPAAANRNDSPIMSTAVIATVFLACTKEVQCDKAERERERERKRAREQLYI